MNYRIYTDATADFPGNWLNGVSKVDVIPMNVEINEQTYFHGPYGNLPVNVFYNLLKLGHYAKTTQINPLTYKNYFERALKKGQDVLYLGFSSGMSGCMQSANIAVEELREEYPQRKILCIDTLCASVGEGLLVLEAARKQFAGMELEELAQWVLDNRLRVCHWFTVDTFDHLKHGGRVSAASAAAGTMLNIKPMLHVDEYGKLTVTGKPRGRKKAVEAQLKRMDAGWMPQISEMVIVGHGGDPERAELLREEVAKRNPKAQVYIAPIGPIIGAHTGPGMLALVYFGNNR